MYSSVSSAAPTVERVWMGDSSVDRSIGHRSEPVLGPDLVFTLRDGTCTVAIQGPVTTRKVYPHRPGAEYIGLRFRPGVRGLLHDVAMHELRDQAAPGVHVRLFDLERLMAALPEAPNLEARGALLVNVLARTSGPTAAPSAVTAALDAFEARIESNRVGTVANSLGVSERQLQRLFREHVGLTPKHAARLIRVNRLLSHIASSRTHDLATMAATSGYFDQAHMTNEVARVLDTTPAALVDDAVTSRPSGRRHN